MNTIICLHLNKVTEQRLFARSTQFMPAEYITREVCPDCGEISSTDDTLYTDIVGFVETLEYVTIADIDTKDSPDFCDAYIQSASKPNGQELSEDELEFINESEEGRELTNKIANVRFNGG
jgi:hypothetical protein